MPPQALDACGFALLEALVAVAILAVLAAIAMPSFREISEKLKVRSTVDALTTSIYFARAEAFRRGGHVTLARVVSNECIEPEKGSGEWGCGWIVFADDDDNRVRAASEEILQATPAQSGLRVRQTRGSAALNGSPLGVFSSGGLGFIVSSRTVKGVTTAICISSGGRIRALPGLDDCPD
ncbi:GspH/FimT family protein [Variovorax sp. J22R133]|uniref:GspH/FimT family protein n=1 Tax=Variovorax brevis TaxID=3053503 RepID=UPI002575DF41|nr:GspH/FimT family protein [Variovorax sp. J22R133]MDM0112676.1 GspH/FimT family protein [Variovorax sp. J22R133]